MLKILKMLKIPRLPYQDEKSRKFEEIQLAKETVVGDLKQILSDTDDEKDKYAE